MDFVFGIPSYKRAEKQSTLSYINRLGYSRKDIYISTKTEEDYRIYSSRYSDKATILYRQGNCVADNRNTILEGLKDFRHILFLDDDITGIGVLAKEGKRSEGGAVCESSIKRKVRLADKLMFPFGTKYGFSNMGRFIFRQSFIQ